MRQATMPRMLCVRFASFVCRVYLGEAFSSKTFPVIRQRPFPASSEMTCLILDLELNIGLEHRPWSAQTFVKATGTTGRG